MSADARSVTIEPAYAYQGDSSVTVWPVSPCVGQHPELRDRLTVALYSGAAVVTLRPTLAVARELVEALQWAIAEATGGTA